MEVRKALIAFGVLALAALGGCSSSPATFETPEAAVAALDEAVSAKSESKLREVLGSRVHELRSGDAEQDRADFTAFASKLRQSTRIESVGDGESVLLVGDEQWVFPAPLVRGEKGWSFDTDAGIEELTTRRIGANELAIIAACYSFIEAETEYGSQVRDGSGVNQYTARLWSTPGTQDGLYWPTEENEEPSPLGPVMAAAVSENGSDSYPFYGYYFRPLLKQGPSAVGGAMDYSENGRLVKGIAGVAFPADYGTSGIMTFLFSMDGVVYQKDLGPETQSLARSMQEFDPGEGWTPVDQTIAVEGGE
ncbi:MAG: DUF2950 family protein [Planctomycetes bacterium]|nr:DUF2950 family protein [Planctomycetota bacterium]